MHETNHQKDNQAQKDIDFILAMFNREDFKYTTLRLHFEENDELNLFYKKQGVDYHKNFSEEFLLYYGGIKKILEDENINYNKFKRALRRIVNSGNSIQINNILLESPALRQFLKENTVKLLPFCKDFKEFVDTSNGITSITLDLSDNSDETTLEVNDIIDTLTRSDFVCFLSAVIFPGNNRLKTFLGGEGQQYTGIITKFSEKLQSKLKEHKLEDQYIDALEQIAGTNRAVSIADKMELLLTKNYDIRNFLTENLQILEAVAVDFNRYISPDLTETTDKITKANANVRKETAKRGLFMPPFKHIFHTKEWIDHINQQWQARNGQIDKTHANDKIVPCFDKKGEEVKRGETIARIGETGRILSRNIHARESWVGRSTKPEKSSTYTINLG